MIDAAEQLGFVISTDFANMSADVLGQVANIKGAFLNLSSSLAEDILPALHDIVMSITNDDIVRWVESAKNALGTFLNAAKLLAAFMATRMVIALAVSAKGFYDNMRASAQSTASLIAQKFGAEQATRAHTALAYAIRATVMASRTLGGVVGIAITGLVGVMSFLSGAFSEHENAVESLNSKLSELGDGYEKLSEAQKKALIATSRLALREQEAELDEMRKNLAKYEKEMVLHSEAIQSYTMLQDFGSANIFTERAEEIALSIDILNGKIEEHQNKIEETKNVIKEVSDTQKKAAASQVASVESTSKAYEALASKTRERIAELGKESEFAKFEAKAQLGLIEDMSAAEIEKLKALYMIYDARKAIIDATEKEKRATEQAKKAVDDQLVSLREQVALLGKSNAQVLEFNLLKNGATQEQVSEALALQAQVTAYDNKLKLQKKSSAAIKESNKALEDYKGLIRSLQTSEEARLTTLKDQLDVIQKSGAAQADQALVAQKALQGTIEGINPDDMSASIEEQRQIFAEYYSILDGMRSKDLISEQQYQASRAEIARKEILSDGNQVFAGLQKGMQEYASNVKNVRDITADATVSMIDGLGNAFISFFDGTEKSFADMTANILKMIAQIMLKMAMMQAMESMKGAGGIWGSIASAFGGSFASGGYTGHGGKYEPAGIVHKGEVVFSQRDVARFGGVAAVERVRLRGYSDGGIVGGGNLEFARPGDININIVINEDGIADVDQEDLMSQIDRRINVQVDRKLGNQRRDGGMLSNV